MYENGVEQYNPLPERSTFYDAVIESPQWKAWYEHAETNHLFDVAESAECGWMSQKHFQAFIEFCKTLDIDLDDDCLHKEKCFCSGRKECHDCGKPFEL